MTLHQEMPRRIPASSSHAGLRATTGWMSYVQALESAVGQASTVLDVGCGNNSPLGRFRRRPRYSVGVDVYAPWLDESRARGIHDHYIQMDALEIDQAFSAREFEVVMACDLLEHLERDDASRLLMMMELVAIHRVIVLTPNGYLPQGATWSNPYQVHRSGWTADEMQARGYRVKGLSGSKSLRGERGMIRFRPRWIWGLLSRASQPLAWRLPNHAFHLLCIKDLRIEK